MQRPTLFFLHSLGASGHEWKTVVHALGERYDCIALDIPGFGGSPPLDDPGVTALVDWFCNCVAARAPTCWYVVGHSMGGKLATLAAARARSGVRGLAGLTGVVLVAASPPAPEPMAQTRRARMLAWFGSGPVSRMHAERFVAENVAGELPAAERSCAIEDVLRSHPQAWAAWLRRGSRQDCSAEAGELRVPALIVAGAEDGDLGEQAQRTLNVPHYCSAVVEVIDNAAHLIPVEQPDALAILIAAHVQYTQARRLPDAFVDLLNAERVVPRMRRTLLARHAGPALADPGVLSAAQREVLAALAARVIPGTADSQDLARRIDVSLARGEHDGWRFADLPADLHAWPHGLDMLDTLTGGFARLDAPQQQLWLDRIAQGAAPLPSGCVFDARQLARWFEDVRATLATTWTSLPATFAAIGYDGFAVGGAGRDSVGYQRTGADSVEPWQLPVPERL